MTSAPKKEAMDATMPIHVVIIAATSPAVIPFNVFFRVLIEVVISAKLIPIAAIVPPIPLNIFPIAAGLAWPFRYEPIRFIDIINPTVAAMKPLFLSNLSKAFSTMGSLPTSLTISVNAGTIILMAFARSNIPIAPPILIFPAAAIISASPPNIEIYPTQCLSTSS